MFITLVTRLYDALCVILFAKVFIETAKLVTAEKLSCSSENLIARNSISTILINRMIL